MTKGVFGHNPELANAVRRLGISPGATDTAELTTGSWHWIRVVIEGVLVEGIVPDTGDAQADVNNFVMQALGYVERAKHGTQTS